jgi:hypothetical protein
MLNPRRPFPQPQAIAAFVGLAVLEAAFEAMRRLGDLKLHVVATIALGLAAGIIYFVVLFTLRRLNEDRATFWLVLAGALVFRLTLAPLEPSLSTDIHRYRWDGHVQQAGWNPYLVRPEDPRLASLRNPDWSAVPGRETPTVYPPVAELIYRWTWRLLPGPVGFKLPFLLADLLVVCLLAGWIRATGGRSFQLAIYAWNPLVVVEFAASGHNDALALAGLVAAVLIIRRAPVVSTLLLTAAALTKFFPAVLLPLWLRRAGWPRSRRGWAHAPAALALVVVCVWPYRAAWLPTTGHPRPAILDSLAYFESRWQNNNASVHALATWFSGSAGLAAGLGAGMVLGLALWAAARHMDVVRAAYLLVGALLILAPNGFSWYFTWIVPLLCFFPNPAWLLLTVTQFLSYNVLIDFQASGRWHFNPFLQWLTYAPFYALLLWQRLRGKSTNAKPPRGKDRLFGRTE